MIRFPKPVTAHMLRHTVATTLLFNGCPIGHIKDILGHHRLITTCNFYLAADKRAAKKAPGIFWIMSGESDRSSKSVVSLGPQRTPHIRRCVQPPADIRNQRPKPDGKGMESIS
jgi:hypothetical protein